mgnify:CR=1 FL=1
MKLGRFINGVWLWFCMYTQSDLQGIVGAFRDEYVAKPVYTLEDVKRYPNDILFNYLISDEQLDEGGIRAYLSGLDELSLLLEVVADAYGPSEDRPRLQGSISYDDGSVAVAVSIEEKSGKFTFGREGMLLAADAQPKTHTFPSGDEVEYHALVNEDSANVSFLDMGYGVLDKNLVYVRKQFLDAMGALLSVYEENGTFASYADFFDEVREQLPGFVYAHEVNENQLIEWGLVSEDMVTRELTSEEFSKDWLSHVGVSQEAYELFHLLKSGPSSEEIDDISRIIMGKDFCPLR